MKLFKPNIQRLAKKKNVRALIKILKDPGWDTSIRSAAVSALVEMSDVQAVEAFMGALKDSDSRVRQAAATALGQLGYTRAMEALIAAPEDNKDWVRQSATATPDQLSWHPVDEIQSASLAVAQQDWDRAVSLGSAALAPLLAALEDNKDWVRKRAAAAALGRLGDSRAVEPLIEMLRDSDRGVRLAAAAALGRLGDSRAVEPLVAALNDNNSGVHLAAATILGQLGDSRAVEPLVAALNDNNSGVRLAAAAALGQLGDSRAVEPLVAALNDNNSGVLKQAAVAAALGRLGDSRAVEPLAATLNDNNNDSYVRQAAAAALGQLGDSRAVEPLVAALNDNNSGVRKQAVEALGRLGDSRAVEPLIETLNDSDSGVRLAAAAHLGQLGWQPMDEAQSALLAVAQQDWDLAVSLGSAAVAPLVVALEDNDSGVRQAAAAALGQLGDSRAVEPLVAALNDNNSRVRKQAVEALGRLGDSRAIAPLVAALEDNDSEVRQQAAEALGQLGWQPIDETQSALLAVAQQDWDRAVSLGSAAVAPLVVALKDNDRWVRKRAIAALGRLEDSSTLIKALMDSDSGVFMAVVSVLREIDNDALKDYLQASVDASDLYMEAYMEAPIVQPVRESIGPHEVSIGHKEQESVNSITQKEASRLQPQLRHLHARYPERVRVGDRIPLQVRVAVSPALSKSTTLRAFSIPPQGVDVQLVLDCPGFLLHSASIATVHVVPEADSDWALFEFEALHEGVSTLEVSAFHEGAFLGSLSMQLTVDRLAVRGQNVERVAFLSLRPPQEGEVTLVIHYDPFSAVYRYQFRSATFGETDELRSGPLRRKHEEAIADLIASVNEQARDLTGYSAEETRRWLQGKGIELWDELIPKELQNVFWQQHDNIKCLTILSAGDPMPWEVMYPTNDVGDDAGFLAEQFPVVRWMFGPAPTPILHCIQPFFVMPEDAPPTAEDELAALKQIIGGGQEVNELTPLLSILDHADFDMLHFACHNIFRSDSPTTSCIQIGSKQFVPTFLSKYKGQFYRHSPLVFINACRSGGMAANYTWLAGWAKSFLTAGAGAFIGSSWEVRDTSASRFAEEFYQALFSGVPLGDAMKRARTAIQNEPGDPTWLAYTLYGNPAAILSKETPKLG